MLHAEVTDCELSFAHKMSLQTYTFDLTLGRYIGSKFQNLPFYLHCFADTSSVNFIYNVSLGKQLGAITTFSNSHLPLELG